MNGTDLLTQFRESRSEAAFSELVRRYTSLVYSAARRRLANDAFAQEATQIVFIRLARSVPKFRGDAELAAWLHRTTLHAAVDLWRSESRRAAREEQAAAMQFNDHDTARWNEITPVLDDALNQLNQLDRQALLLRFFQQKTMRDLGNTFGVSEDAAKMRVSRALDRLRHQLTNRGVTCTAIALGSLLAQKSIEAAPGQLAEMLAAITWPAPATGLGGFLLRVSKIELAGAAAGLILAGIVAIVLLRASHPIQQDASDAPLPVPNAIAAADPAAPAAAAVDPAGQGEPDPLKLLQGVARARNQIVSGSMELDLFMDRFESGRKETNYLRLSAIFDGSKKWFDSVGREFRYSSVGSEGGAADQAKIQAQNLDREGAVRAGLLAGFEAHYVTIFDGTALLQFRETDRGNGSTTIRNPREGTSEFVFDPRCLGLRESISTGDTVESCLGLSGAASVQLVGLESLEGTAAWHVKVRTGYQETLDFWIDSARPTRVLRQVKGSDVVNSKYDGAAFDDVIPIEVTSTEYHRGALSSTKRFVRTPAEVNVPIDSDTWTLAGLHMPVGTVVTDSRISRSIGYWNGTGLVDHVRSGETSSPAVVDRAAQLALLENNPASPEALAAAHWILLNTPDGADVEKAAYAVLYHHITSPELATLAGELERLRHRGSRKLLEAMVSQNPYSEVQAAAAFTLATLLKDEADYGKNQAATRDAERYFEMVINKFGRSGPKEAELARRSKPELDELRRLTIGHPAPELEGVDLDGQVIKLSDYRGKVVVVFFWSASTARDAVEQKKVLEPLAGRFTLIGVNCDEDLAKAKSAAKDWNWPNIHDSRSGPISAKWNVHSWLSSYIIDAKGVIRYRNLRDRDLANAVGKVVAE